MTIVLVVRHGDTFAPGEPVRRIGARSDPPLTAEGRAQAGRLRARLAAGETTFDEAWTSPLRRTRETAAALVADIDPVPRTASWLAEIDHGRDEDRPEVEVVARIGAGTLAAWDRDAVPPPGWVVDGPARLAAWRGFLARRSAAEGTALMVTSNGAARFALLATAELAADARALPSFKLRTGACGRLVFAGGAWRIDGWDERP
ncbi:histidine phosphatase family protein [uncultured Sphingomonas sp.]|uniref:histidine phosphatase family protein n=1 Tax=uncultured Sphingomonas sp. TaxID=158754 RepID=UPI0035CC5D26